MKNKKRYAKCIQDYVEDEELYWSKGCIYKMRKHRNGNYDIKTNFNSWGSVGADYLCDCFEEYFEVVWL